jgi:glutamyl-tRNA synthetase
MEGDFLLEDVTHSPAFFDLKKLAAFNGEYIRALSTEAFVEGLPSRGCWPPMRPSRRIASTRPSSLAMAPHIQPRCVTLADAVGVVDFLFLAEPVVDEAVVVEDIRRRGGAAILAAARASPTSRWGSGRPSR